MSRWEKKYESYKKGLMGDKLKLYKIKEESKTLQKEEYKEYKQMQKVQENLPKVENLIEFKKQIEAMRTEIIGELSRRNDSLKLEEESVKLEEELNEIIEEKQKITEQLKNKDLSEEDKGKLQKELSECENKYQDNNNKYLENSKKIQEAAGKDDSKTNPWAKFSKEELSDKAVKLAIKMSVCDLYASRLMKGYESLDKIQDVEKDIDWTNREEDYKKQLQEEVKKYKLPKEQVAKMEKLKKVAKQVEKEHKVVNKENESKQQVVKNSEAKKVENETEKAMVEVSEFDKKHPRLAKIKNWFKGMANKVARKEEVVEETKTTASEQKEQEEIKIEKTESKENKFKASMKFIEEVNVSDIAEKGMDGVREERRANAMKTLLENKEKAEKQDSER